MANNGIGIAGLSPSVKIMCLKFMDETGAGFQSAAILGMAYAIQMNATVQNHSWGSPSGSQTLQNIIRMSGRYGQLMAAAAGNDGADTDNPDTRAFPAAYSSPELFSESSDYIISVGEPPTPFHSHPPPPPPSSPALSPVDPALTLCPCSCRRCLGPPRPPRGVQQLWRADRRPVGPRHGDPQPGQAARDVRGEAGHQPGDAPGLRRRGDRHEHHQPAVRHRPPRSAPIFVRRSVSPASLVH